MGYINNWLLLVWMVVGGAFLFRAFPPRRELVDGVAVERWGAAAAILLVLPYIILAGVRSDGIADTGSYRWRFLAMPTQLGEWGDTLEKVTKDPGFTVVSLALKFLLGNRDELYFMVIAAFQLVVLALLYRRYSCNYWLSIFIFVASTDYISWCTNGMRQFLAVTIILAGTKFMLERRWAPLVVLILLASTIHATALMMLPVVWMIQGQAWNRKMMVTLVCSVLALVAVDQFTQMLSVVLEDTQYTTVVSDWQSMNDDGTSPIRVLVYAMPTILSLVGLRSIRYVNDPVINLAANASIVSTALYMVSMVTSGIYIGRLPIYVSLYATGILLPWELKFLFEELSGKLATMAAVVLYTAFFYYQMHGWGLLS